MVHEELIWFRRFWKRVSQVPREKGHKDDAEKELLNQLFDGSIVIK
jgi:hypothetical protein